MSDMIDLWGIIRKNDLKEIWMDDNEYCKQPFVWKDPFIDGTFEFKTIIFRGLV